VGGIRSLTAWLRAVAASHKSVRVGLAYGGVGGIFGRWPALGRETGGPKLHWRSRACLPARVYPSRAPGLRDPPQGEVGKDPARPGSPISRVDGHNGEMDLSEALAAYDRVALNLDKLDRVWQRMEALVPDGAFIDGGSEYSVTYSQLAESWNSIAESLPAIDGWRLDATIVDYAAIGRTRVDFDEAGEWQHELAFKAQIFAPKTEALRYRRKLARARQVLVRRRAEELVRTVDRLLASVPTGVGEELPETEVTPVVHAVKQAIDEIERLLGDALRGGPRETDLYRHLSFGEPHDLRDIAAMDWPAFRPHVELALYDDEDPVPVHVDDLASLATVSVTPVSSQVHWDRIDADGFERLLARLLEQSASYGGIKRLMNVNAPDAGRDI
jgi:hypothetical protein